MGKYQRLAKELRKNIKKLRSVGPSVGQSVSQLVPKAAVKLHFHAPFGELVLSLIEVEVLEFQ